MRTILPALICAALVSCEKPADDVARRLTELEQRAEAAEARSEQLEQQAAEDKLADERDAIERERMNVEEERIQLIRMQDDAKAEAERKLEERERALAARETTVERMQDELDRSLDDADDLSRQIDERDRELAGREALATVREETAGEPVADYDLFYDSLSSYGSWFSTPQYGYVWQPVVVRDVSWRPYTRGRWVCTDHGWTWVSDEPFGWATYHYGRWALVAGRGWVWVPGSEWAPAWVCWRYGSSHIGWAPLPPESLAYRHWAWDANIEATLGIGSSWFCFVETRNFCEPVRRHCLPYSRHRDFWNHTRNVTRFQHVRGRTICGGPSYGDVSRKTARPIPFYRLETDRDGRILDRHPRVSNGRLRMQAPNVDVAWNAGLRPKNLRGTWSDVAIQRDREPEADVRRRFEETRVKDRQRAEQTIQRLGGPEKFPAKRREELAANRGKRNPERQSGDREMQRRETPRVATTEQRRTTGPSEEKRKPTRVETPKKKVESETRRERTVSSDDHDTRKPQLPPGMEEKRQDPRGQTRPVAPRDPRQRLDANGRRAKVAPDVRPAPRKPDSSAGRGEAKRRDQARRELEEKMKQSAARERERQQRFEEARRQQAETARRETARREQEARQRELMQRAEEQRQRNDRAQREAEQNRRQQDADRREQAARQQAREESKRRQEDDMRRQQERVSRQREEQASRQREEQQARRQQEEASRRQQEEASRRQQEESSRRQQAEERQRQEQRRDEQNRNRRNR